MVGLNVSQGKVLLGVIGEVLTPQLVNLLPSINKVTDDSLRTGVIGMRPGDAPLWETARPILMR